MNGSNILKSELTEEDKELKQLKNTLCYILRHNHNMDSQFGHMDEYGFISATMLANMILTKNDPEFKLDHPSKKLDKMDNMVEKIKKCVDMYDYIFFQKNKERFPSFNILKIKAMSGHTNDIRLSLRPLQYKRNNYTKQQHVLYAINHIKNIKNVNKYGIIPTGKGEVFVRLYSDYTLATIAAKEKYGPRHLIYICLIDSFLENHPSRKTLIPNFPKIYVEKGDFYKETIDKYYTTRVPVGFFQLFEGDLVYKFV